MRGFPVAIGLGFGSYAPVIDYDGTEVTPTGPRGKAKENLRNLLAESSTFQDAIGATGLAAEKIATAKLRIHKTAVANDDMVVGGFDYPLMFISSVGNDSNDSIGTNHFAIGGDIELRIEWETPIVYRTDDKLADAEASFEDFYETIMAEAMALCQMPGYFAMNGWDIVKGPLRHEPGSKQQYVYGIKILINWGLLEGNII